jgi:hypothetical protein
MLGILLFFFTVVYEPSISIEDAWDGPGTYYYKVEFGPGDMVHSGVSLDEEPEDWQAIYDTEWQRVAPWAVRMGYPIPHDGCWERHDCPPMETHMAEIGTANVMEAAYYFLASLLRSLSVLP